MLFLVMNFHNLFKECRIDWQPSENECDNRAFRGTLNLTLNLIRTWKDYCPGFGHYHCPCHVNINRVYSPQEPQRQPNK